MRAQTTERDHIRRAIEKAGGHINGAAAALGINHGTRYGRMRKLGITLPGSTMISS